MEKTTILKLGGSIITYKNDRILKIRLKLIRSIAGQIKRALEKEPINLILIHGAGSFGHRSARAFNLHLNPSKEEINWLGVIKTKLAIQKLNTQIIDCFVQSGLSTLSISTSSIIAQENGRIVSINLESLNNSLNNQIIPILNGDMAFDRARGASICSGDQLAPYLAQELKIEKIFFATDVDGIFSEDPHKNSKANFFNNITIGETNNFNLSGSHSEDATDGMYGKFKEILKADQGNLKEIIIFNGLKAENYFKALTGENFKCTKIKRGV